MNFNGKALLLGAVIAVAPVWAHSQSITVTGIVVSAVKESKYERAQVADVALWLEPVDSARPAPQPITAKMIQKNKAFKPRLLILPAGSSVEFPNNDPYFHNVFSLFNGKRFDLGLYEAGDSKKVHFDRVGVSYIFCNIHPEMSAIIVTVNTPYYGATDSKGSFSIQNVPEGVYELHMFADGISPESLKSIVRRVTVRPGNANIGAVLIPSRTSTQHKNKYGRDYETPAGTPYEH